MQSTPTNWGPTMSADALVEWLAGCPVTSVTAGNTVAVTPEPAPLLDVTPVTAVTSQKAATKSHALPALSPEQVAALESMAADTADRHAGRVPEADTAAMHCQHCGPVWIHPAIAACLPVVAGWPRALGCPWCFVRKAGGYIPRPPVTCGDCQHFTPDTINPPAGMGTCASGHGMHYPMQQHRCGEFQPGGGS